MLVHEPYDGQIADFERPVLIAAAHGTRSPVGLEVVADLVAAVRARRPELDVRLAFVDVSRPFLADVVAGVPGPLVAVPVLLSRGYHVRVDIPAAVASRDDARIAVPLGPSRAVSLALADRLATARRPGTAPAASVVLVATGSSDPDAAEDLAAAAADLAQVLDRPVHHCVLSGPGEDFATAAARCRPGEMDVVPYLLADGVFLERLRGEAAELGVLTVGGPIGAHPAVVGLILDRYAEALANSGRQPGE